MLNRDIVNSLVAWGDENAVAVIEIPENRESIAIYWI